MSGKFFASPLFFKMKALTEAKIPGSLFWLSGIWFLRAGFLCGVLFYHYFLTCCDVEAG